VPSSEVLPPRVVIAIDPRKASWTAAAVDAALAPLATLRTPVNPEGYRRLRGFAVRWPTAVWAIEGARALGQPRSPVPPPVASASRAVVRALMARLATAFHRAQHTSAAVPARAGSGRASRFRFIDVPPEAVVAERCDERGMATPRSRSISGELPDTGDGHGRVCTVVGVGGGCAWRHPCRGGCNPAPTVSSLCHGSVASE
jgi:hypothetical protein